MNPCISCSVAPICGRAANQPFGENHVTVDDVFIGQMHIPDANTLVPQHSHAYSHASLLAAGSARVWAGSELLGDFKAPKTIQIDAGVKHSFLSLEDNTVIYCIHNVSRSTDGAVEIAEEHHIIKD